MYALKRLQQHWLARASLASTCLAFSFLLFVSTAQAADIEAVSFRAASPLPTQVQRDAAKSKGELAQAVVGDELKAYLAKPAGTGPFGAVVALQGAN